MTKEIPVHPVQIARRSSGRAYVSQTVTLHAYEVYAELFKPQPGLITGGCRGGFGSGELIALLYARSFPKAEWQKRFHEAIKGQKEL